MRANRDGCDSSLGDACLEENGPDVARSFNKLGYRIVERRLTDIIFG
jgi:hypothetical protein